MTVAFPMFGSAVRVNCTAGVTHCLLHPNGDVYRCISDANAGRAPVFNAAEEWSPRDESCECGHGECGSPCDVDWTLKRVSEGAAGITRVEAGRGVAGLQSGAGSSAVHVIWIPSFLSDRCHSCCRYADEGHDVLSSRPSAHPELAAGEWERVWERILSAGRRIVVSLPGSRPLVPKFLSQVIRKIAAKAAIGPADWLRTIPPEALKRGEQHLLEVRVDTASPYLWPEPLVGMALHVQSLGNEVQAVLLGDSRRPGRAESIAEEFKRAGVHARVSTDRSTPGRGGLLTFSLDGQEVSEANWPESEPLRFDLVSHRVELDTPGLVWHSDGSFSVAGRVVNTGNVTWLCRGQPAARAFKVGGRIFLGGRDRSIVSELRGEEVNRDVKPGCSLDFEMRSEPGWAPGTGLVLEIDVVKEGDFWFVERGTTPFRMYLGAGGGTSEPIG